MTASAGSDPVALELVAAHGCASPQIHRLRLMGLESGRRSGSSGQGSDNRWEAVTLAVEDDNDVQGMHGAPVFVGGKLLGFALQVRCVERPFQGSHVRPSGVHTILTSPNAPRRQVIMIEPPADEVDPISPWL